jgi:putative ABC transport system permease protein
MTGLRPPRPTAPRPPRLASLMLQLLLPATEAEFIVGDLDEEFEGSVVDRLGVAGARRWYWSMAVASLGVRWRPSVILHRRRARGGRWVGGDRYETIHVTTKRTGGGQMDKLWQDVHFALRSLRRNPGFTLVALLILTLGIGANTAMFTVVNSVLMRPLPFPQSDQLVRVWTARSEGAHGTFSMPDFQDWAERTTTLSDLGLYSTLPSDLILQNEGPAEEVKTAHVSAGFFEALGVPARLGRTLLPEEEYGQNRVVVLSHNSWIRRFGSDPAIVGRTLTLKNEGYEVVGVMPEGFGFPDPDVEMWTFLTVIPAESTPLHLRQVRFLDAVGRLAPGATVERATEDLGSIATSLSTEYGDTNEGLERATVEPLRNTMVGDVRTPLLVLLGAVGFILLIACANVANLLLARGTGRRTEVAVRTALGAPKGRLVRQVLTESVVLAGLGGAAGVALSFASLRGLATWSVGVIPRATEVGPDLLVLAFAVGMSVLTGLLFGVLPALAISGSNVAEALKVGGRGAGRARGGTQSWLVGAEVAVAVVLLVGAGLLLRSLWLTQRVDPGFVAEDRLAVTLTISASKYAERPAYMAFYREALDRFGRLPGVVEAGSIRDFPMQGAGEQTEWGVVGDNRSTTEDERYAQFLQVSPGLFRSLGIELRQGRAITALDTEEAPLTVVINERLARLAFGGELAVGRTLLIDGGAEVEVVGVVADVKHFSLREEAPPVVYVSQERIPRRGMTFVLHTAGNPLAAVAGVRQVLADMDPDQPISEVAMAGAVLSDSVAQPRFFAALLGVFALLALVLASLGIYGVISYQVGQQTREIGIRLALGAERGDTVRLVLRGGMVPAVLGTVIGLGAALALTRVMGALLFGVGSADLPTYLGVATVLLFVAGVACLVPARRATRIDPVGALRAE